MRTALMTIVAALALGLALSGCRTTGKDQGPLRKCEIDIAADGTVAIRGKAVSPGQIGPTLKQLGATSQTIVVIKADSKVQYPIVRGVIDQVVGFGCTKVQFGTQR